MPKPEVKPEIPRPEVKPDVPKPEVKPDVPRPEVKPDVPKPEVKPEIPRPEVKPDVPKPEVKPDVPRPEVKPDVPRPEVKPEIPKPEVKPDIPRPEVKPDVPRPDVKPEVKPDVPKPEVKPDMPELHKLELKNNIPHNENRHHLPHHRPEGNERVRINSPRFEPETVAAMNIMQNVQQTTEPTVTQMRQRVSGDAMELFFTGLINLNDLAETLKNNSKSAKSKLILAMANASKHGIDNSQINDTLKLVSASMAASESSTPSKILKNIIELYLPWYPLQQGVGFDLSIETQPGSEDFLSVLKVWIQTRNYGNVNAVLTLITTNSVDMNIKCSEDFPKDNLLKNLNEETHNHTMQSNISIEEIEQTEGIDPQQQAKVNLSSTYDMNPYLLLMAHSFIKNTIVIDSNSTIS